MTQPRPLEPADLYRLRLVSDPQIAPDGSRIAFVLKQMDEEKNEYVSNIHVVDREGNVTQFTSGGKDSAPRWSPDGRYLAFLSARDEGKPQIRLLSAAGGESIALTDRPLGAGVPFWSPDSTAIVFTGATSTDPEEEEKLKDEKDKKQPAKTKIVERASYKLDGAGYIGNRRRHLFRIDVAERKVEQLTSGDFHDDEPAWSPDSRHIAFSSSRISRWDVTLAGDIYIIPREGGEARKAVSGNFDSPMFSPDGSRIAFTGREDGDDIVSPARLYSADRGGGDRRDELGAWDGTLGDWNISDTLAPDQLFSAQWREDGIYFLGTVRGEANVFRARDGRVELVTSGAHTVTGFSLAGDGTMALARGDATHLADIVVRANGEERRLTSENDALLGELWLATPERLGFTGANGEESEGWLLAPRCHESGGKFPLIVYLHGGPQFAHGEAFFFEYQLLAGHGFGVFYPNIHGSTSYGRDYQASIRGDWGNLDFQDVLAGTEAAASRPWVDPHRLGIAGGSYGGYITLWTISHSDRFRAALAERCLSNFVSFMGTSDSGWIWNRIAGAFPEDDVDKLWEMSPMKHVANITAPVLVMHSERDDRTPIEQGEQVFLALRRLGKDTKLIMFPEESHGLTRGGKPSRRVERLGYVLEWFREKL
jgi:dipeptidyl aminopeptidase/acylaminoacyl peptidase